MPYNDLDGDSEIKYIIHEHNCSYSERIQCLPELNKYYK